MGVVHKLKPEVRDLILEKKKNNPHLSCRKIVSLLEKEANIKVSKSSINFLFKEAGLSAPIGRKSKGPGKPTQLREALKLVFMASPPAPLELPAQPSVAQPIPTPAHETIEQKKEPAEKPVEIPLPQPVEEQPQPVAEKVEETPLEKQPEEIIIKETPQVKFEDFLPTQYPGSIILKAADYLIGGAACIAEAVKLRLRRNDPDLLAKTEGLLYGALFNLFDKERGGNLAAFWSLIGKKITLESINSYLEELEENKIIISDVLRTLSALLQEVRFVKVILSSGGILYLDGQLHMVWSTPYIPYDFSNTIHNAKGYLKKYFDLEDSFILFMAPGYDIPTQEFFNFLLGLEGKERTIRGLTLNGNGLEELESYPLREDKKHHVIFGFWPWQFSEYREVKRIGEFKPFYFEAQKKNFYLAEMEMDLSAPDGKRLFNLRGCALKMSPEEKIRLVIMSDLTQEKANPEALANSYLSHWPNLEEAFQDTNRKIELFTYTVGSQRSFSAENLSLRSGSTYPNIKEFFQHYLNALDAYVRWHFLPAGYEDANFITTKERFYGLNAVLERQKDSTLLTFQPAQEFKFSKDLGYLCRRLNEREITFPDTKRLWFSI